MTPPTDPRTPPMNSQEFQEQAITLVAVLVHSLLKTLPPSEQHRICDSVKKRETLFAQLLQILAHSLLSPEDLKNLPSILNNLKDPRTQRILK